MSTILKALRRLEEDRPAHAPTAPVTADGELRERILAEDSAAHIGQPDSHADAATDGLSGDSFASNLRSLLTLRTLMPIALGLVLVLCLGVGVWYWTGGAESLSPAETLDAPAPAVAAVAPPASDSARAPSTAPSAAPLSSSSSEASGAAASQRSERGLALDESASDPSDGASDDGSERTSAPMPVPVAAVVVQKDEQETIRTTNPAGTSRTPSGRAASAAEPAPTPSRRAAAASARSTTAPSTASPMASSTASPTTKTPPRPALGEEGKSLEPARAARAAPPASERTRVARTESPPSTASEPSASRAVPDARPRPSAGESRPAAGRPAVSAAAGSPREVERLDRRGQLDVSVVGTSWHPSAERRSAKVRLLSSDELLTLREGDAVGAFLVQEISPSAVVFSAGEVEIRRRVGQDAAR